MQNMTRDICIVRKIRSLVLHLYLHGFVLPAFAPVLGRSFPTQHWQGMGRVDELCSTGVVRHTRYKHHSVMSRESLLVESKTQTAPLSYLLVFSLGEYVLRSSLTQGGWRFLSAHTVHPVNSPIVYALLHKGFFWATLCLPLEPL